MNRTLYFNFIEEKLNLLAYRIDTRGGLNILDIHIHSEDFYLHFFNLLFGWKLQNLNVAQHNAAAIDLVDSTNKIILQVSATGTKQKVESALTKDLSNYYGYSFKFISISKNANDLKFNTYKNPHALAFTPVDDIYDVKVLLTQIKTMDIDSIKNIYDFLKKELKSEPDPEKVESNLTTIINILSKEDWNQDVYPVETIPYDIEAKITYNQLNSARVLIEDYSIHHHRISKIYSVYDKQAKNKSLSVLNGIRWQYITLGSVDSPDQSFTLVIDKLLKRIKGSANYTPMPEEELELCVQILVVDAFIRCKIFENPIGDTNAHS